MTARRRKSKVGSRFDPLHLLQGSCVIILRNLVVIVSIIGSAELSPPGNSRRSCRKTKYFNSFRMIIINFRMNDRILRTHF